MDHLEDLTAHLEGLTDRLEDPRDHTGAQGGHQVEAEADRPTVEILDTINGKVTGIQSAKKKHTILRYPTYQKLPITDDGNSYCAATSLQSLVRVTNVSLGSVHQRTLASQLQTLHTLDTDTKHLTSSSPKLLRTSL